jgi:hypothetical protein
VLRIGGAWVRTPTAAAPRLLWDPPLAGTLIVPFGEAGGGRPVNQSLPSSRRQQPSCHGVCFVGRIWWEVRLWPAPKKRTLDSRPAFVEWRPTECLQLLNVVGVDARAPNLGAVARGAAAAGCLLGVVVRLLTSS